MKPKKLLTALLAALVLLTFAAPFTQALESAPFAVMQGASTQFVLFGKFKNDGTTDRNTIYSNFTNVTIANTGIAEAYQRGSQWYVIGKANDASSSFTATLANGETVTGTIVSFKKWTSQSRGGSGGTSGPTLIAPTYTISISGANNTVTFTNVSGGSGAFDPADYTWSWDTSLLNRSGATFTAIGSEGTCVVTATHNVSGNKYSAPISIVNPQRYSLSTTVMHLFVYQQETVSASYPISLGQTGTWSTSNSNVAAISTTVGNSTTVTAGATTGTATLTYAPSAQSPTGNSTVTVNVYDRAFNVRASWDSYYNYGQATAYGYASGVPSSLQSVNWNISDSRFSIDSSGRFWRNYFTGPVYLTITATNKASGVSNQTTIYVP